jgi:hypothetical protein
MQIVEDNSSINKDDLIKLLGAIKRVFETMNNFIVVKNGNTVSEKLTSGLVKLQRAVTPLSIQNLKKILIFLKEHKSVTDVDVQYVIK